MNHSAATCIAFHAGRLLSLRLHFANYACNSKVILGQVIESLRKALQKLFGQVFVCTSALAPLIVLKYCSAVAGCFGKAYITWNDCLKKLCRKMLRNFCLHL